MSLAKDNIWKLLAPLVVMGVMFLIPVPDGMPPQAWHYFAVFVAMIVGMILEPIPATAISFIAVTICVIGSNYLLFDAKELADPAFNAQKQALKWGLAGFSSTTVWLVFGAFIFALGYEVSGLGRRIALFLVKFMGKRTLTLGYAIVIIDILLAPFTPSNTARTGGTVFPVIKNLPPLFKSFPNDPSARRIGGYLMWMMVISTSLSSSMFVTGAAPNVLGLEFVSKIAGIQISWLQWFLCFLPVGVILLIIAPWLSYVLYKPEITHSEEVATWAGDELKTMGADHVVNSRDSAALKTQRGKFDLLLCTVNVSLDWKSYLNTLAPNGSIHMLGMVLEPMAIPAGALISGAKSVTGSPTGSPFALRQLLQFAARKNIAPQIELYPMSQINDALARLHSGQARYRIVLKADF